MSKSAKELARHGLLRGAGLGSAPCRNASARCALVPAYGAEETVGAVVRGLCGSTCPRPGRGRRLLRWNGGEAARRREPRCSASSATAERATALRAGLDGVLSTDATHVAFVDADGQHDPADLPRLLEAARGGRAVRDRLAHGGARRDPGLPLPDQRDRQPDPLADDRPRGRGRAVRLPRRRRRSPAQAGPERARLHHRDRDPAQGRAAPPALSRTCRCARSTAVRRTTGRSGTRG